MKIATWNVERLKHKASLEEIRRLCEDCQADILVLTETDARLHPNYRSACHTPLSMNSSRITISLRKTGFQSLQIIPASQAIRPTMREPHCA
jgi:Exonuclease III